MNETPENLRRLEKLVAELLKDAPAEDQITALMAAAGIPDSKDPIDRINKVLLALHFEEKTKDIKE